MGILDKLGAGEEGVSDSLGRNESEGSEEGIGDPLGWEEKEGDELGCSDREE